MRQGYAASVAALAFTALATVAVPVGGAGAQTTTMDFSGLGPNNYDPIPVNYGSTGNLTVTNHTVTGFGNTPVASFCGGVNNNVEYWGPGYGGFPQVAFPCYNGGVAQFFFQPSAGNQVFLNSLMLGSYPTNGTSPGPARNYTVNVYDAAWGQVYTNSGIITADLTLSPGVSSAQGLYLQVGTDWDVGIGSITTTVSPVLSAVPEPATYALLAPGLLALGMVRRRRRLAAV
jgi:hypothetical protein